MRILLMTALCLFALPAALAEVPGDQRAGDDHRGAGGAWREHRRAGDVPEGP